MVKIITDGIIINQQNHGEGKTAQASVAEDRNDDFLLIADDRNSCSNEDFRFGVFFLIVCILIMIRSPSPHMS